MTSGDTKISSQFRARLASLGPHQMVRAVILPCTHGPNEAKGKRLSRAEREKVIAARREATERALPEIERVLQTHGGQRISGHTDALGSILVETTAVGILALADTDNVKAVLEDQPISLDFRCVN